MRGAIGLLAIPFLVVLARADTPRKPGADPAALSERATMLAPIQIDSLTLTPIVATGTRGKQVEVLTLDQGMAAKQVKIKEKIDSDDVNNLTLINSSNQPLFVLAGEVIIGGKQDRIIGKNTVIPANTTQTVPVFCVEHGRWDNSSKEFTTAKALAHGRLRGQASFAAQQDVWNEVNAKNRARGTGNDTDTYRKVAKQQQDGTMKQWMTKVDGALAKIPAADRARMIGYAVSLNGKVATVDMFQSPGLFKKLEGKLVQSYVTDAVDIKVSRNVKAPTPTDVKDFIADAETAAAQQSYETKASSTTVHDGKRAAKAKVMMRMGDAASSPATVYENYQVK
ncbi:MAG: DUF6569 family protein [Kofleriaceae bacterium]